VRRDANVGSIRIRQSNHRLGGIGPALIPENLGRLKPDEARRTILEGRVATQMPAFTGQVDEETAGRLVEYVFAPPAEKPAWGLDKMQASHRVLVDPATLPDRPVSDADPLNLFVVVELGDHHATILDGDRLEPIHRFETHNALHGGPKFSPDGRFVYFASRNGWVTLEIVQTLRPSPGKTAAHVEFDRDGKYVLLSISEPAPNGALVIYDAATLKEIKHLPMNKPSGKYNVYNKINRSEGTSH
jgi:hypothetical protein